MVRGVVPFTFLTFVVSVPVAATAATPGEVCAGAKLKASGKVVAAVLACEAKAAKAGGAADDTCVGRAVARFTAALAKADARGGCAPAGDLLSIAMSGRDSLRSALRPVTTANGCASAKLKAAGRKAKGKLACHAKATARGLPVDPTCLVKAEARFAADFAKAETRPPCLTTGDAASVENVVDDLVADVVAAIPTGSATTTTTTASTTTTFVPGICGNGVVDQPGEDCDWPGGLSTCDPSFFACRAPGQPGECTCCGGGICSYDLAVPCCDPFQVCINGPGPLDSCAYFPPGCVPPGQPCIGTCCLGAVCTAGVCQPAPASTTTTTVP